MRFDSGPEVLAHGDRSHVLTEYVLNEDNCTLKLVCELIQSYSFCSCDWKSSSKGRSIHFENCSFCLFVCLSAHECPEQLDEKGNFSSTDSSNYQSIVTLHSCDSGYRVSLVTTTTCQADGTWTTPVPKCDGK